MIRIKYNKYFNDFKNAYETKSFNTLNELADWMFNMVTGEYKKSLLYFTNPDDPHMYNEKLHLDSSCIKTYDGEYIYWIH